MRQNIQKARIGIRHWRTPILTKLHIVYIGGQVGSANEIQPLLHLVFVNKPCVFPLVFGGKESIQVKFIEFPLHGDLTDAVGDAVGQHDHARQGQIRIARTYPIFLGALLVGISPVEDLIFDEFARIDGAERRTREKQIIACCNGQKGFIVGVSRFFHTVFFGIEIGRLLFVRIFKEFPCILTPRAEMILVKNHQIPIGGMDEFVFCLDTARFIRPEQILKRAEYHNRTGLVRHFILTVYVHVAHMCVLVGDKLPTVKVYMDHQILAPCRLNCRFEGQHKDSGESHFLCQLVGSKCLAKTHFGIPQHFVLFFERFDGLFDRCLLLITEIYFCNRLPVRGFLGCGKRGLALFYGMDRTDCHIYRRGKPLLRLAEPYEYRNSSEPCGHPCP